MYPLVKKIFGNRALGGSTPNKDSHQNRAGPSAIVTIGSYPNKKRTKNNTIGLSQLDTVNDDNKYIILEERSFHASTTELRAEDAAAQQKQQQQEIQARATRQPGW